MNENSGYVYFIQAGTDGPVKVGWAKGHPERRLKQLQTAHHERLKLLASIPGSRWDEAAWHSAWKQQRVGGEWFNLTPDLEAAIGAREHPEHTAGTPLAAEVRTAVLQIRLTPDEKAAMEERARERGQPMSELIRECTLAPDLDEIP